MTAGAFLLLMESWRTYIGKQNGQYARNHHVARLLILRVEMLGQRADCETPVDVEPLGQDLSGLYVSPRPVESVAQRHADHAELQVLWCHRPHAEVSVRERVDVRILPKLVDRDQVLVDARVDCSESQSGLVRETS